MKLTIKEQQMLDAIKTGMDEPGCGWLHEVSPFSGKTCSGVLSSLVKKGLVRSTEDNESGHEPCYWVELAEQ